MSVKYRSDERGLVSIMVTLIMILVISLIVLGFAQVTRRNQRESLDNQLSTQAFYAAEAGINDAKAAVRGISGTINDTSNCDAAFNDARLNLSRAKANLSAADNVAYTCLKVSNSLSSLPLPSIPVSNAIAVPLNTNVPLTSLTISWSSAVATGWQANTCSMPNAVDTLPPVGSWGCSYGLIELDLTQDNGNVNSPALAAANTLTFYLKPSDQADGIPTIANFNGFSTGAKALLTRVKCQNGNCKAVINLQGAASTQHYYARLADSYADAANVIISSNNPATRFQGALAVIDATGKAQDVLRRVQETVSLTSASAQAGAAVQTTGSICKLIQISGTGVATDTCVGAPPSGGTPNGPQPPDNGADFKKCPGAPGCPNGNGNGGQPYISWGANFVNTTSNPDATAANVASCTWNWGDAQWGDPNPTSPPNPPTPACYTGQSIFHHFYPGNTTPPFTCRSYTVTLTIVYTNGSTKVKQQTQREPYGSAPGTC